VHPAVDVPVVVLGAQYGGLGVARTLGRWGVPAYGVHALRSAGLRSRYWRKTFVWDLARAPYGDSLRFLLEIARQIGRRHAAAFLETAALPVMMKAVDPTGPHDRLADDGGRHQPGRWPRASLDERRRKSGADPICVGKNPTLTGLSPYDHSPRLA
jgi:hypothetical protein